MPNPNNPARPSLQARLAAEQAAQQSLNSKLSEGLKPEEQPPTHAETPHAIGSLNEANQIGARPLLNPSPQAVNVEQVAGLSPAVLSAFADLLSGSRDSEYPAIVPEVVDLLIEALMGWRAALHGALSRLEHNPSLNPSSDKATRDVVLQGIYKAEQLALTLQPFATVTRASQL